MIPAERKPIEMGGYNGNCNGDCKWYLYWVLLVGFYLVDENQQTITSYWNRTQNTQHNGMV